MHEKSNNNESHALAWLHFVDKVGFKFEFQNFAQK